MAEYVKFEVSKELMDKQLQLLETAKKNGKVRIGANEVTKAVERGEAKLVLIAQDVDPKEIVMHLPLLCDEKNIPYSYVATKKDLGNKAGIGVGTTAIAITDYGDSKKDLDELVKKLAALKK